MKANKRRVVIWKRRETLVMAMKSREKRRAVVVVVVGFKVKKKKKKKKSSMTRCPNAVCGDRPLIGGWLLTRSAIWANQRPGIDRLQHVHSIT